MFLVVLGHDIWYKGGGCSLDVLSHQENVHAALEVIIRHGLQYTRKNKLILSSFFFVIIYTIIYFKRTFNKLRLQTR